MTRMRTGAWGVCLLLMIPGVRAENVSGFGAKRCSDFMAAAEQAQKPALDGYVSWVQGFIGGFNWRAERRAVPAIDPGSLTLWLVDYCGTRRSDYVYEAAQALVEAHAS